MAQATGGGQKLKVFVSYSRSDIAFADELVIALDTYGFEPMIDRHSIAAGEDWKKRLGGLIVAADTVVFVLSPDSVVSEICKWEIEETARLSKRILPVILRDVGKEAVPQQLRGLNYTFFSQGHSFAKGVSDLVRALNTDFDWIREHTRYGEMATRWEARSRPETMLLRGGELDDAKAWSARRSPGAPELTIVQCEFIRESEAAEAARHSKERQQLEAMAVEQRARARFQRRSAWALGALAVLVLTGLVTVVLQARETARREATVMTSVAQRAIETGHHDRAMRIALQGLPPPGSLPLITVWSDALEAKLAGGAMLSRLSIVLRGHRGTVISAAFSREGRRIVTTSSDQTAREWDAETGQELATFEGHQGTIWTAAAFTPDGERVVTSSDDGISRLWDARTGLEIRVPLGDGDLIGNVDFSSDGTRVATVSNDGSVRIRDAGTGRDIAALIDADAPIVDAGFSPDGARVVTTSKGISPQLWEAGTGKKIAALMGHQGPITGVYFSPDSSRVVTVSADLTARVWDTSTGQESSVLKGYQTVIVRAAFSPDGTRVVTAGEGDARVWDWRTEKQIALKGQGVVRAAAFSPDGTRVVTASDERVVRVWDAQTGREIATLVGHDGEVKNATFSPDGLRIVSVAADNTARLWNWVAGREIAVHTWRESLVSRHAFSPDGSRVVTASDQGGARIWEATTGRDLVEISGHEGEVISAIFNSDGSSVVTTSSDRTARVWNAATGQQITAFEGHVGRVLKAAFSPDGRLVVTASDDKTARVWEVETGRQLVGFSHDGLVSSVAFSPDGTQVLTGAHDGSTRVWDTITGRQVAALEGHGGEGAVNSAVFSHDGRRVLAAWNGDVVQVGGIVRIWDPRTGHEILLKGHPGWIISAVFSPDDERVVTAGQDSARLWNSGTGQQIAALSSHKSWLQSAEFSSDGARVVTTSADGTARLWDAQTGQEIAVLEGHDNYLRHAVFSPDDRRVLTVSTDGTARIWDVSWAMKTRGQALRESVCTRKLIGAQEFTLLDAADPILAGLEGTNPCTRRGPLSAEYWTPIPGELWSRTRTEIAAVWNRLAGARPAPSISVTR